jgi:hypothetical protein
VATPGDQLVGHRLRQLEGWVYARFRQVCSSSSDELELLSSARRSL